MDLKTITFNNALFSCSNTDPIKGANSSESLGNLGSEVIKTVAAASNELKLDQDVNNIQLIKVENSQITLFLNDAEHSQVTYSLEPNLSKQLSNSQFEIKRDLLGEKILELSKKQEVKNLYLYSSGGGGHKSAKDAEVERDFENLMNQVKAEIENETMNINVELNPEEIEKSQSLINDERLKDPTKFIEWCKQMGLIEDVDVLHDYLGKVGKWASDQWDNAQIEADVEKQESLASKQWLSDIFFGPVIFISTLRSLIQFKPKKLVSTQAMATPSILLAVKVYNSFFKPKEDPAILLNLYMTDMPTEYATHFFNSIKRIATGQEFLKLHTPKPQEEIDWKELCGLNNDQVVELDVKDLPVRRAFLKAVDEYKPDLEHPSVEIKVRNKEDLNILHDVLKHQGDSDCKLGDLTTPTNESQYINYSMKPEDKGTFIMLGSQPTLVAIQDYIKEYIELARENPNTNYHFFAVTKTTSYKALCEFITNQPDWPSNLRVVPLTYQEPKQLISLEMMCDTITRSGGGSIMELLVLNEVIKKIPNYPTRNRYIHAQPVKGRSLEESIAVWEKGNFFFFHKAVTSAKVVDPRSIRSAIAASA